MKIAYVRGIDDQDIEEQLEELRKLEYDTMHVEGEVSGKGRLKVLESIITKATHGDILCITDLTKLGRAVEEIVLYAQMAMDQGVSVFSVADNKGLKTGDRDLNFKLLATLAERDRRKLVSRIQAGRKIAVEKGVKFGRKKGLSEAYKAIAPEVYRLSESKEMTGEAIREKFGIGSRNTLTKILDYQKEAERIQKEIDDKKARRAKLPNMKLLYLDIETTGPDPVTNSIHHLALIVEVNGVVKLRESLIIRPREFEDLPEDYRTPNGITKKDFANPLNYVPPAEALSELDHILSQYIDTADPADRFFIVGYGTEGGKLPFLRGLFTEGPQRYEDYFTADSLDAKVLATYYLWPRYNEFKDFSLGEIFRALGGREKLTKALSGNNKEDAEVNVEFTHQVYKKITADFF